MAAGTRKASALFSVLLLATVDFASTWMAAPVHARSLRAEAFAEAARLWQPSNVATLHADDGSDADTIAQRQINESEPGDSPSAQEEAAESLAVDMAVEVAPTMMRCLGTTTTTRACHFQDMYYDVESGHFIYFGPPGAKPDLFGEVPKTKDPWLRLIRGGHTKWKNAREQQFFLDWRSGEAPPPAAEVALFDTPLHLRSPMNLKSLGHFLRDNLLALIDLPMRFGREPTDFDWVRWPSQLEMGMWQEETRVSEHYRGLFNNRPSWTWQEVLDNALKGQPSGVKYVRFAEIIAGQGPVDMMSHVHHYSEAVSQATLAQWAHICSPYPFTTMRSIAYRNLGMEVASVADLEPFVLFMDGRRGEKRFLANADEVIPQLQETFPGVRMEHVEISKLTLEAQMDLISRATVVVSNVGSRSFRLIYLPNGAHVILVGPPEYEFALEGKDDKKSKPETSQIESPFFEIESCWGYIGYVEMLQYHVEKPEEVVKSKPWKTWADARNSDILLDAEKLAPLLRLALQTGSRRSTYTGAGTLAAFEPSRGQPGSGPGFRGGVFGLT